MLRNLANGMAVKEEKEGIAALLSCYYWSGFAV